MQIITCYQSLAKSGYYYESERRASFRQPGLSRLGHDFGDAATPVGNSHVLQDIRTNLKLTKSVRDALDQIAEYDGRRYEFTIGNMIFFRSIGSGF